MIPGSSILELVRFLRGIYPDAPIRGYVISNNQIIDQAKPSNLTKDEDWVWLRLEDLTAFEKCRQKGVDRAKSQNLGSLLKISILPV